MSKRSDPAGAGPASIGHRKATLVDVAETAGVSTPTVSKVLNGRGDVAPETRRRVQEALEAHDYLPRKGRNASAAASIEFVTDAPESPYSTELLVGALLAGEEYGVDVVVSRLHRRLPDRGWMRAGDWAKRLAVAGRSGAVVLMGELEPERLRNLAQERLPIVAIDPLGDPGVPTISSTNWAGGRSAAAHLLNLGHRRIGIVGGRKASLAGQARVHGFRAALESFDVPVDAELMSWGRFNYESGLDVATRWLARPDRPTAILTSSDSQAMGVVEAARRAGLRVPDDLSVTGYNDVIPAMWASPPLTTVRQPLREMGRAALRQVLQLAEGGSLDFPHIELATELVIRDSTAPPAV
jgi:LacI family transcriptional regulator